ncbi:MAG: LamG domain-containing protein, partial [Candidatus Diapherotrites archaeon]|nr:LamG domain-containing protein [Candidatus Diapherotrites archaeon]
MHIGKKPTQLLALTALVLFVALFFWFFPQNTYYEPPTGLYVLGPDFFEDDYSNANGIAVQNNVVVENGYVRPTGAGGSEIDPNGPLGTGLIALWHFNGNANDSKGSLNGTLIGSTVCNVSGKFGQACSLDDTGGEIAFGQTNFGEGLSAMTFSVWFKNTQTGGFPTGNGFIALKSSNVFQMQWDTDTKLYFGAYNSGGQSAFASSNVGFNDTTNWHHLAGVYSGSNVLLYLDGVLQNAQGSITGNTFTSGNGFDIGLGWKGLLDEIGVWNRALSSQEIQSLYTAGGGISGNFESININPTGNLYSLGVDWNETGAGTSLEV